MLNNHPKKNLMSNKRERRADNALHSACKYNEYLLIQLTLFCFKMPFKGILFLYVIHQFFAVFLNSTSLKPF